VVTALTVYFALSLLPVLVILSALILGSRADERLARGGRFHEKRSNKEPNRGACGKHPEDGFGRGGFRRKRVRPIREEKEGGLHPVQYGR
jgi:hypothetical protein